LTSEPHPTVTVTATVVPSGAGVVAPAGSRMCSGQVFAAGTASCPFALVVGEAVRTSNGAGRLSQVYSPTTGKFYDVTCEGSRPTTCRTGRATIYVY
jgi:hypothetical protein